MIASQPARVPGIRRPHVPHFTVHEDGAVEQHVPLTPAYQQARHDAATLRAAAAIVEAQEGTRPHLVALRNRLLSLATQIAPTTDHDQEDQ